jgi:hypothetical protein
MPAADRHDARTTFQAAEIRQLIHYSPSTGANKGTQQGQVQAIDAVGDKTNAKPAEDQNTQNSGQKKERGDRKNLQ